MRTIRKAISGHICHLDIDTPAPADPFRISQADALFNRIDQITPFGSLLFSGPERNIATLGLSPELTQLFGGQLAVSGNALADALGRQANIGQLPGLVTGVETPDVRTPGGFLPTLPTGISGLPGRAGPSQLPGLATGVDIPDFAEDRQRVEEAFFERQRGLLDPVFSERREQEFQRLANQGIPTGGAAATGEFGTLTGLEREQNRALQEAALGAVQFGGQEQQRLVQQALQTQLAGAGLAAGARGQLFGEDTQIQQEALQRQLSSAQLAAGARGQLFGEQTQLFGEDLGLQLQNANLAQSARSQMLNELAQVLGQQQVAQPGLQNFFTPGQVDVPGAFGLAQQGQQFASGQSNAAQSALLGGLFGLGSAGILGPLSNK